MNRLLLIPALLGLALCTGCSPAEPEYVPPAESIPNIPPSSRAEGGPAGTTTSGGGAGSKLSAPAK